MHSILAVDDSRTIREMLGHTLREAGYRVVLAEDGVHGLEVLQTERPDVIVTDINMPRLDGFGFIEAVRAQGPSRTLPILVLTTESEPEKTAGPSGRYPFTRNGAERPTAEGSEARFPCRSKVSSRDSSVSMSSAPRTRRATSSSRLSGTRASDWLLLRRRSGCALACC